MNALDASVLLAIVKSEPGADAAISWLDDGLLSAVNLAEVLERAAAAGKDVPLVRRLIDDLKIGIVPFDDEMAADVALLWRQTKERGLSFADRACLALAKAVNGVAVTADRSWAGLEVGVPIQLIR